MSLIHTCELNGANPFDYLTELLAALHGTEAAPVGVDALELPRELARLVTPRAARHYRSGRRPCSRTLRR